MGFLVRVTGCWSSCRAMDRTLRSKRVRSREMVKYERTSGLWVAGSTEEGLWGNQKASAAAIRRLPAPRTARTIQKRRMETDDNVRRGS